MSALKVFIVEDEQNNRERLIRLLNTHFPELEITGTADSVTQAVEGIKESNPNLVYLDVELTDGLSFEIFEYFSDITFEVIFTTAYDKYALKAIKLSAIDFLLKPIDVEELKQATRKAMQRIGMQDQDAMERYRMLKSKAEISENSKIALPTLDGFQFVEMDKIIRLEAEGSYTRVIHSGKNLLVSKSLKDFEDLLSETSFCRIHHSHIVNLRFIEKYVKGEGGHVVMTDGAEIDVSRRKKEEFLSRINKV